MRGNRSIAAVLITRIATCLPNDETCRLREVEGTPISVAEGRQIVNDPYVVPESLRRQRRTVQQVFRAAAAAATPHTTTPHTTSPQPPCTN